MFSAGLAEIVLIVADVERSARFYAEIVGLEPETPPENIHALVEAARRHGVYQ